MTTTMHRRRVRLATAASALSLTLAMAAMIDPLVWMIVGGALAIAAVAFAIVAYVDLVRRPLDDDEAGS